MNDHRTNEQLLDELNECERRVAELQRDAELTARQRSVMSEQFRHTALSTLTAELIHELNQPLIAIHNYAQAIQHAAGQGVGADLEFIANCSRSLDQVADDASRLIGRLSTFDAKLRPQLVLRQVNDIVRAALEWCRSACLRQGVRLDLALDPMLPDVPVDALQIEQVLLNLLGNALEALATSDASERVITVRTTCLDDAIQVSIADSGPGVAPEVVGEIFKPMQSTKRDGLGIGLTLADSIVEAHRGSLVYKPLQPQGACFTFTLPRGEAT